MSTNDEKILILKKKIDERKAALGKTERFAPITSCSLEYGGTRYNLHVQDANTLYYLLCSLRSLEMAAEDLDIPVNLCVSGYPVSDWITDIKGKLAIMERKANEEQLKMLEAHLDKMLSADKRTELELDEIAKLLK